MTRHEIIPPQGDGLSSHPREGWYPYSKNWIPADAGMMAFTAGFGVVESGKKIKGTTE